MQQRSMIFEILDCNMSPGQWERVQLLHKMCFHTSYKSLTSIYMRLSPGDGKKSGIRDRADVRVDGTNWFLV